MTTLITPQDIIAAFVIFVVVATALKSATRRWIERSEWRP